MITERMTFSLKYGNVQAAGSLWRMMAETMSGASTQRNLMARIYSSLSGRSNVLMQDLMLKSINDHNPMMYYWVTNPKVQETYKSFVEMCDCSVRDMFNVEHEVGSTKNFTGMICERNIFRLKFGKAKDSIAIWKELMNESKEINSLDLRLMTDVVGPSYTMVVEAYFPSMKDIDPRIDFWNNNEKLTALHQKFIPLCNIAERDYLFVEFDM